MTDWTSDQLTRIGDADELHVRSRRGDGTLNNPRIVWVVRDGDELYLRSVNGRASAWFRGVQRRHAGHIRAGGVASDVTFTEAGGTDDAVLEDRLDTAYRSKYSYSPPAVARITSPAARTATLKITPA